jgi:hypothetical protein
MTSKRRLFTLVLILGLMVGVSATASGAILDPTVLFDGGSPDGVSGLRVSDVGFFTAADDFQVPDDAAVNRAEFWTVEIPGMFDWTGVVNYFVFENVEVEFDSFPASVPLYSGQGTSVVKEADPFGFCCGYDQFRYSFEFDPPLMLQANTTYWLAINLPASNGLPQAFWASTGDRFQSFARTTSDPEFSFWTPQVGDLAFRLLNVPAPGQPVVQAGTRLVADEARATFFVTTHPYYPDTTCGYTHNIWLSVLVGEAGGLAPGGKPGEVSRAYVSDTVEDTCSGDSQFYEGEVQLEAGDVEFDRLESFVLHDVNIEARSEDGDLQSFRFDLTWTKASELMHQGYDFGPGPNVFQVENFVFAELAGTAELSPQIDLLEDWEADITHLNQVGPPTL